MSPKIGSKLSQVHSAPNLAQPACPGSRACRIVAPQAPCRGSPSRPCCGLAWSCGRPGGRVMAECRVQVRPCRDLPRDTGCLASCSCLSHNTLWCIAIQCLSQPSQPTQSQYNRCIVTHLSPSQNCTTAIIQFVVLQCSS